MRFFKRVKKKATIELVLLSLPAVILFIMFNYIPMFGLVMAFKEFSFADGIWDSPWNGLDNFKYLFLSGDLAWRLTRNTVGYYIIFTITGTIGNVLLAIGINEMVYKKAAKYFQSAMILPAFISYIAVSFVVYGLLNTDSGMINQLIESFGGKPVSFYLKADYWPVILTVVKTWKTIGYGSVLYLSVLMGIDQELYDAADVDGANAWQKMRYITIPMLVPTIVVMTLLGLGHVMNSDTGLFYQVTQNSGMLYSTTQVWDSYVLNSISTGTTGYGMTAAATFFQSVVGSVMVIVTNLIVRKQSPENSLF